MNQHPATDADLTVDGTGLLCVTLLVRLRAAIAHAQLGTTVHVIATDPAAPLDLPAWCHLTGHTYLGPLPNHQQPTYALRVSDHAHPVAPDAPWRPTTAETDP